MTVIIPVTEQSRAIWDSWQDKCNVFTLTFGVPRSDDVRNWMSRDILDQSAVWTCQCPANERFFVRRIMFLSLQDHWVWHRVSSGGGIRWIWTFLEFKTFYQGPTFISSDIDNEIMPGRVFANIRSVKLANKVQGDFLPTTLQLWNSCVRKCCFVICCALQLTSVVTGNPWSRQPGYRGLDTELGPVWLWLFWGSDSRQQTAKLKCDTLRAFFDRADNIPGCLETGQVWCYDTDRVINRAQQRLHSDLAMPSAECENKPRAQESQL